MKKVIWIVVVLVVAGYFINSYTQKRTKEKADRVEAERIEKNIRSFVSAMVSKSNAVDNWEEKLSKGERYRYDPILTIELEKLWLVDQPILFIGSINDIATHDESHYLMCVERNLLGNLDYLFDTELQLSLISKKEQIDIFLNKYPDLFKEYGFNNGVAIIAKINAIRTTYIPGEEGERKDVKIGYGELIDILYAGDVTF